MRIVGLISNEDELDEMEYVAKVFLLEQRMKKVSNKENNQKIFKKTMRQLPRKIQLSPDQIQQPRFTVRGLN